MVDMTYGSALFQAAKELNKEKQILDEAEELLVIFDKEPSVPAFINNPVISATEKKDTLKKIFEGRLCTELLNFLYVLVDKGRTRHISKMIDYYREMVNREEGFSCGKIFSAVPLDDKRLKKFEEETGKLINEKVKLDNQTDRSLIGGVRILIDGKVIDASIRKRLKNLGTSLR